MTDSLASLPRRDEEQLRKTFMKYDRYGNGTVNVIELGRVLRAMGVKPTAGEMWKMFGEAGTQTSQVGFNEFMALSQDSAGHMDEQADRLRAKFLHYDQDNSGSIDIQELRALLVDPGAGLQPSEAQMRKMYADMDADGSGQVDFEELLFVTSKITRQPAKNQQKPVNQQQHHNSLHPPRPMSSLEGQDREQLRTTFLQFSRAGNGTVRAVELGKALRAMGVEPTPAEMRTLFASVDEDGSGQVDFNEFMYVSRKCAGAVNADADRLHSKFRRYDKDASGCISITELHALLQGAGIKPTDAQLRKMYADIDRDGSGAINFEELLFFSRKFKSQPASGQSAPSPHGYPSSNNAPLTSIDRVDPGQLRKEFTKFDRNGTGFVNVIELGRVLTGAGVKPTAGELRNIFVEADLVAGGRGNIQFAPFVEILRSCAGTVDEGADRLQQNFVAHDRDGSGSICCTELRSLFAAVGVKVHECEFQEFFNEMNADGSAAVEFDELLFFTRKLKQQKGPNNNDQQPNNNDQHNGRHNEPNNRHHNAHHNAHHNGHHSVQQDAQPRDQFLASLRQLTPGKENCISIADFRRILTTQGDRMSDVEVDQVLRLAGVRTEVRSVVDFEELAQFVAA